MHDFRFKSEADFNPASLGKHLCINFSDVLGAFVKDRTQRIHGLLSSYIYDVPQFPGDKVEGGIHYSNYVQLPTSLIPQKQPALLKQFSEEIKDLLPPGMSFFDIGPGPAWSVRKNTVPALNALQPSLYLPVDLELPFTSDACQVVSQECSGIDVKPVVANFHQDPLPNTSSPHTLIWYPGSTLGNLPSPPNKPFVENHFVKEHLEFLRTPPDQKPEVDRGDRYLILLMDRRKEDIESMLNLYRSQSSVNCFLSILVKLKRDLKAQNFDPSLFEFKSVWNDVSSAVEHTFTATQSQEFQVYDGFDNTCATIKVVAGEKYALANSIKPNCEDMQQMLAQSGWSCLKSSMDADRQFHIHLAKAS